MKPELKPCPFCDGEAYVSLAGSENAYHIIKCKNCGCSLKTTEQGDTRGTAWNRRAPAEPSLDSPESKENQ